jgi:hypothetical protein
MTAFLRASRFMLLVASTLGPVPPATVFHDEQADMLRDVHDLVTSCQSAVHVYEWSEGGYRLRHIVTAEADAAFLLSSAGVEPLQRLRAA